MNAATGVLSSVHPVVRIVSFVLFSLFLVLGNLEQIAVASILLTTLYFQAGVVCLVNAWPMLWRMRWFFISILIIYAWLTPGQAIWTNELAPAWIPTVEGALMAGHRILVLVLMVLAVQWLLWVTTRAQLISALYWLAMPLALMGFSRGRFAVRVALVLGTIERVQEYVASHIRQTVLKRSDVRSYAVVAAALMSGVVQQGEEESCHTIEIDVEEPPPLWQWLWPLTLMAIMLMAS